MKYIVLCMFMLTGCLCMGQDNKEKEQKAFSIQNVTIEKENVDEHEYKKLKLEFTLLDSSTDTSIVVDDKSYRYFPSEEEAISYFKSNIEEQPEEATFYVKSETERKPQVLILKE